MSNLTGKSFLIRVDGSHAIGLGHIYRMKSLAKALQKNGNTIAFLTQSDEEAKKILKDSGFPCYEFKTQSFRDVLHTVNTKHKPDIILQDILKTSTELMTMLRQCSSARIINFDDIGAGLKMADAVINCMVFHWEQYTSETVNTRLFEGPFYMIFQEEINSYIQLKRRIMNQAENILLTFGGTDTHYVTERAVEAINNFDGDLRIKVNIGPGGKISPNLQDAIKNSKHQILLIQSAPSLIKEFHESDIVICAGGIMLYELAALGIPSISIATEKHEIFNTNYWSDIGSTVSLGWEKEIDMNILPVVLMNLHTDKIRRTKMSQSGKKAINNCGIPRIMKIFEELNN